MGERQASVSVKPRGRGSFLKKLFPCFSPEEQLSESSLNSDFEYVVENRTVYRMPHRETLKDGQAASKREEQAATQHGGRPAWGGKESLARPRGVPAAERFLLAALHRRRVYEYIRMKTYQNMNLYRMSPNDFLNNISSVFVENLKDPIPKDPNCLPRVYNNQPYGFSPEKPLTIKRTTVYRNSETETDDIAFSYREALEDDQPYQEEDEKVLVWKIVVVHQNKEDKQN